MKNGRWLAGLSLALAGSVLTAAGPARAGLDPFIGEMMLVPYNFCPRGFAEANGQLIPIAQYTALFSLLGTTFGGNGQTTFGLPDLRGRTAIGQGTGPGLSPYTVGQVGGVESFTITTQNMPAHSHSVRATSAAADKPGPANKYLANDANQFTKYSFGPADGTMAADMITTTGGSQPLAVRSPYLTMRWCIALEGIYPSRN